MTNTPNNPPAFPGGSPTEIDKGMTLLDYFAGQAMQGMTCPEQPQDMVTIVKAAYEIAQAMLSERDKYIK